MTITETHWMVSNHHSAHKDAVDPKRTEARNLFLIIIMAVLGLLTIFVETMLVPALPGIAQDLSAQSSDLAWVLTAYTLAGAVAIPIAGKMGEMYGRKRVLLAIMIAYMVGLTGAALSWDLLSLIVFRTVQGIGMGAITLLMGMAKDILPLRMVPVGIGLISAMIGVGAALGLVMGGLLISFLGWKDTFWVVLPVVALVVAVVHRSVPDVQIKRPTKMDVAGSVLLGLGILSLLLPLSQGDVWGWGSALTLGLFACAIIFFAGFVFREKRFDDPILRLELLRNRNISVAYITMFFIGVVMFMLFQTLPFFLGIPADSGGFGITSQVIIGLFMLPNAIAQLISSPLGGKWGLKVGHGEILILGMAITMAGLVSLSLFRTSQIGVLITLAMFGFGIGLAQVGNTNLVSVACTKENFGSTTAVNSMILTIGMSAGPVLASLIVAGSVDPSAGYAYCWVIAAALALVAAVFVLLNRSSLVSDSVGHRSHDERSPGGE
ncbi:MAG: MFS transporter [Methanomassiliicoccus sp.]|nr:MFS transporter [Methanomassiliicoccus sp.]